MFLEDAGRTLLAHEHDLSEWVDAARWAALFHAATRDLSAVDGSQPVWAGASQALSDPILNCSGDTMPSTKPESQSTASRSFLGRCRHVRWDLSPNGQQELRGLVGEGSQA
jgi:hypothetical protein